MKRRWPYLRRSMIRRLSVPWGTFPTLRYRRESGKRLKDSLCFIVEAGWIRAIWTNEMKRDYGTNGNNGRSAGFQLAWLPGMSHLEAKHAGSLRTGRYFRLFLNPSSLK